jgi:hypothetical protein
VSFVLKFKVSDTYSTERKNKKENLGNTDLSLPLRACWLNRELLSGSLKKPSPHTQGAWMAPGKSTRFGNK